ncbi:MAG: hypothetical protein M1828_006048 [Chrysothrix sp. TS-e1954]|nr:MAG: hypothetical protein M1828_006048 [Chrysothrix sp. TS-e1954]
MHSSMMKTLGVALLVGTASVAACKYPSKQEISATFAKLTGGDYAGFFADVEDNVTWIVEGTHPLAGVYTDKKTFTKDTLEYLANLEDPKRPITLSVVNIIGGCNEPWSAQELNAHGFAKNGLEFDNNYSWNTRWSPEGSKSKIEMTRAYLDSELVKQYVDQNVKPKPPNHKSSDPRG